MARETPLRSYSLGSGSHPNSGHYSNAKNTIRITRKTRFLKKAGFPTFPTKTFIIFRDYVDALPNITGCTGCNKVSEDQKTSGNRL
jgi:hypothetical protein